MNKDDFDLHALLLAAEVSRDVEIAAISSSIESLCLANNCDDDEGDDDQEFSWTDRTLEAEDFRQDPTTGNP
ncbi:hypothetical protein H257_06083 [Aphanomyces astaci]|uniref:Uncharacterized protein n=1 Tax=Aphanomyces astaci TaxID=112090 RepID=W4GLM2_APHAT|nr:hypothetical protein H257_06083 [Aphanomyces astaci]ETV80547.1 hypothetical protein H257_06083 [Aphanomyces astaci]|eukprot:XP_009829494.1 hypothetical protein H257_06083 [Aphanomyces astaci]